MGAAGSIRATDALERAELLVRGGLTVGEAAERSGIAPRELAGRFAESRREQARLLYEDPAWGLARIAKEFDVGTTTIWRWIDDAHTERDRATSRAVSKRRYQQKAAASPPPTTAVGQPGSPASDSRERTESEREDAEAA